MQFSTRHVMSARRAQWGHFAFSRAAMSKDQTTPKPDSEKPEAKEKAKAPESMYQRYPLVTD